MNRENDDYRALLDFLAGFSKRHTWRQVAEILGTDDVQTVERFTLEMHCAGTRDRYRMIDEERNWYEDRTGRTALRHLLAHVAVHHAETFPPAVHELLQLSSTMRELIRYYNRRQPRSTAEDCRCIPCLRLLGFSDSEARRIIERERAARQSKPQPRPRSPRPTLTAADAQFLRLCGIGS